MANPTTNYSFVLPTSSDLVTDLPADFDVALQGVDTRLKALQPGTTLGDLAYSSATANTNTRLGIGSTGNVLTVAAGVPVWSAPATSASGLTLITRASFSGVASTSTTFDNVFTSTYTQYIIRIESMSGAAGNENVQMQFRYAGPTTQVLDYYSAANGTTTAASTMQYINEFGGTQMTIAKNVGEAAQPAGGVINVSGVGNSSQRPMIWGQYCSTGYIQSAASFFGGGCDTARTYTGFLLKLNTGNITGTVSVYGMAKA